MLPPRRIAELLLLFALPALVLTTGCTRSTQAETRPGTAVVIFVDFSESIGGTDRSGFQRELDKQVVKVFDKRKLILPEPIKAIGEFDVPLKLHREVTVPLKVKVVKEGA